VGSTVAVSCDRDPVARQRIEAHHGGLWAVGRLAGISLAFARQARTLVIEIVQVATVKEFGA
jgi:hypothetical protein